jgi:hypothetical protein
MAAAECEQTAALTSDSLDPFTLRLRWGSVKIEAALERVKIDRLVTETYRNIVSQRSELNQATRKPFEPGGPSKI